MFIVLFIGSLVILINMVIQVAAVVVAATYILKRINAGKINPGVFTDIKMMGVILVVLFVGHELQFATWAILFIWVGEFSDFETAFYHSVVNFTSLGYGDIVMSEKWRLLGALEAANGVLMFGLTASSFLAVMNKLLGRHKRVAEVRKKHLNS